MTRFEIYKGKDLKWHWRLVAVNNRIICWSEGYNDRDNAIKSVQWVKINGPLAPLK